jgi:hypothetical protein
MTSILSQPVPATAASSLPKKGDLPEPVSAVESAEQTAMLPGCVLHCSMLSSGGYALLSVGLLPAWLCT